MGEHCRADGSVDRLPPKIRAEIDVRLQDTKFTYDGIVEWLNENGYKISRSAFGRYAKRTCKAAQRIYDTVIRTQALAEAIKDMPDADMTKASTMLLMDGLVQRLSTAPQDFSEMPMDKAGRLIAAMQRNAIEEKKTDIAAKTKAALALEQMQDDFKEVFAADKVLAADFVKIINRIKAKAEKLSTEKGQ